MSRRQKIPRPASTYRGARRNACLRGEIKGVWGPLHYFVKHDGETRIVPYQIRPPLLRFDWTRLLLDPPQSPLISVKPRQQPKTYRPNESYLRRIAA